MKRTIQKIATGTALTLSLTLMQIMPVLAVTEDEVAAHGKEATAGSIFIWFLCAIAFLKISQKIDSFMSALGINVGRTGGSMLGELMIAGRAIGTAAGAAYRIDPAVFLCGAHGLHSGPHPARKRLFRFRELFQ